MAFRPSISKLDEIMKNDFFNKTKNYFEKRRYEVILRSRKHLTEYEQGQLIPELKSRLKVLKQYFYDIIRICDEQKNSPLFTANLHTIINPENLNPAQSNLQDLSNQFFDGIKGQAQTENIDDINNILGQFENINDVNTLGLFINEVNLLCSSLLAVKNRLFLFRIDAYPHLVDMRKGDIITDQPKQYFLTIEPFQIAIDNIASVAKATSDTVHEWHKQTMKQKTLYLDFYNRKLSIKSNRYIIFIQILTIVFAVTLSAFFLLSSDPFSQFKKNIELKNNIVKLENKIRTLRQNDPLVSSKKLPTQKAKTKENSSNQSAAPDAQKDARP
jgi:hypothetical protein